MRSLVTTSSTWPFYLYVCWLISDKLFLNLSYWHSFRTFEVIKAIDVIKTITSQLWTFAFNSTVHFLGQVPSSKILWVKFVWWKLCGSLLKREVLLLEVWFNSSSGHWLPLVDSCVVSTGATLPSTQRPRKDSWVLLFLLCLQPGRVKFWKIRVLAFNVAHQHNNMWFIW